MKLSVKAKSNIKESDWEIIGQINSEKIPIDFPFRSYVKKSVIELTENKNIKYIDYYNGLRVIRIIRTP